MQGRERTIRFLEGKEVDHNPIHPLVMQYACKLAGVTYSEFCLDYRRQSEVMLNFAENYGMDTVHAAGYPWCEAMDYGLEVVYDGDLFPHPVRWLIEDVERDIGKIRSLDIQQCKWMMSRVRGLRHYRKVSGETYFLEGHCEGPLAEYADLRSVERAFMDFFDYPEEIKGAMRIITDNAKKWIDLQIEAGADVISIGDAVCSQIGGRLYGEFVLPLHQELISHINSRGVYSKLHICGNIESLLPDIIGTGVNIIDVDSMVDPGKFVDKLGEKQFFCGNLELAELFVQGNPAKIRSAVRGLLEKAGSKCLMAGGCEIPANTPVENYHAFVEAVKEGL